MKRRQFIGSALASAGLAAIPGLAMAGDRKTAGPALRLGLIGSGARGKHLAQLMREVEGVRITACCDVLPFRLEETLAVVGEGAKAFTDYRRILDDRNIDAVIIATPFHLHAGPMLDALDAGKHVYCEKTLVKGDEQADGLAPALSATDRVVQVGYQHRYSPVYQAVRRLIDSGVIGVVSKVECQWNRGNDWRRPVPSPEYERAINWRMYREYSGGLVAEMNSHQMDICQWLLGARPVEVAGMGGIDFWKDGREVRDNINLLVKYDNGVPVTYTSSNITDHDQFRMAFLGSKGTIVSSLHGLRLYLREESGPEDSAWDAMSSATVIRRDDSGRSFDFGDFTPTVNALAAFRDCILKGEQAAADTESGLLVSRLVQRSLDAMDKGTVETV